MARQYVRQPWVNETKKRQYCASSRSAIYFRSIVLVSAVVSLAAIWSERVPVFRAFADAWIVSDPIAPAEAVAIFGGDTRDRPFAAAEYFRNGLAKKVLIANGEETPAKGPVANRDEISARDIILALGVPAAAIESFGNGLKNTHEEAVALHQWTKRAEIGSIIVLTEIFPSRRVQWTLHRVFGRNFPIRVVAIDPPGYNRGDWWQHKEGVLAFGMEVLKASYYRARY